MIFKGLPTYLRLTTAPLFRWIAHNPIKAHLLTTKINFLQSTQQPVQNEQKKKKRIKKPRDQQPANKAGQNKAGQKQKRQNQQDSRHVPQNLARIIKKFRISLEQNVNQAVQIAYHTKRMADYYKKYNHNQFVEQKYQIEGILQTITSTNFANIELTQYFCLLDFIRICANVESINYHIFLKAQTKVFSLLKNYEQKILSLSLQQLSILYCKVTPVYHPDAFAISSLLHDGLATSLQQNKPSQLTAMQIFVLIRSMGKKEFLSFPDKKILEMLLRILNNNRIDKDKGILIQLAVALKDIQVEVNISDTTTCDISKRILEKAVRYAKKGLDSTQIQYLIMSKKSQNPYFVSIFEAVAKSMLKQLQSQQEAISLSRLRKLLNIVNQLPSSYAFTLEQKQAVLKLCQRYVQKQQDEKSRNLLQYQLLDVVRNGFLGEDIQLLNPFFQSKVFDFVWSFPIEYSKKNVPFPLQIMEAKITEHTSKFRTQSNNLKTAVGIATQARLHPQSEVLQKCYNKIVEQITTFSWTLPQLSNLVNIAVFDYDLVSRFHQQYHGLFFSNLIPSDQLIKNEKDIKKGDKSELLKFWAYLMAQSEAPHQLVSKIPIYAIHLTAFREKKIKNNVIHPKAVLLQAIEFKLSSGKIKLSDQDSNHIVDLLIVYSNNLDSQNEFLCELYWKCVHHLINQYSSLRSNTVPYANYLISKLIHIHNTKIKHSIFYKRFLNELIAAVGILSISNKHDYFKTTIIREGLHSNLMSDLHLPQLELAFYNAHQRAMLNALSDKYEHKQYTPDNIISLFKLTKLPQEAAGDIEKILQVVDKSTITELSRYLQHYALQKTPLGQKILSKICSKFIEQLEITSIDIMGVLKNFVELSKAHFKLFKSVLNAICDKLLLKPSLLYLVDHYQILKTLNQHGISNKAYTDGLWEHTKKTTHKGSSFVSIMLQLSKTSPERQFDAQDIEQAIKFVFINPQDLLKLLIYHEESVLDIHQKLKQVVSFIHSPLEKSLFLAYLQSKYGLVVAKSKSKAHVLCRANYSASKLIKLIQNEGVSIKLDQKQGEYIYHINEKAILAFLSYRHANESKVISKMLHHLYPNKGIIEANSEGGYKENELILNQLHLINGTVFNSQLMERVEAELKMN